MRIIIALVFCFACLADSQAAEPKFKIRPIHILAFDKYPEGAKDILPFSFQDTFVEIYYLIDGENLAGFKEDSFKVESIITKEGKDLVKTEKDVAELRGLSGKVSNDGKFATFAVSIKKNEFLKTDDMQVKGEITLLTGTKRATEQAVLKVDSKEIVKAGPYKLRFSTQPKDALGESVEQSFGQIFNMKKIETVEVGIDGPRDATISVQVVDGKERLGSRGTSWSSGSDEVMHSLPKVKGNEMKIVIEYWTDLKEQKIKFGEASK
jgi:hypothetical protein